MSGVRQRLIAAGTVLSLLPVLAAAGPCDATFNFDGNLADASGNVQDGVMIAAGGMRAKPVFVPGRSGQALSLEGTSAMRAPLDLHFEVCPQVTISAWIKRTDASPKVTQYVLSTGSGSGPGIRVSGSGLALNGPANGLFRTNVIRPNAGWQFVAGVYDYAAGTFQMYYGFRGGEAQNMGAVKPGEDAFWVGAWNDSLTAPATGIQVDDVRIIGSALNKEQVYALQKQAPGIPSGGQSGPTQIPGAQAQVPLSGQIPADGSDSSLAPELPAGTAMTNTSTRASDTPNAILDAAEDSAIPDIGYGSEAEALAAQERREREAYEEELARQQNELEAQRRAAAEAAAQTEAEAAATAAQAEAATAGGTPEFYPVGPETVTEYSGSSGVIEKRADLAGLETFFYQLSWAESYNRPCRVDLDGARGESAASASFQCGGLSSSSRSVKTAMKIPIYAIQVCNNTRNSKSRLKGIRIWGAKINPDGTTGPANVNDEEELANCSRWAPRRECPGNQIATGVVVMARDAGGDNKADITGLRLICHAIGVR